MSKKCVYCTDAPGGIVVSDVEPTSVRVSWQAAENADRYNVTLSKIQGKGRCPSDSHTVSVVTSHLSVVVGQTAEDKLRPSSTYSITVGAVNDSIKYGYPAMLTTSQTSKIDSHLCLFNFSPYEDASVAPRNVRAVVVNSVTLEVRWDGLTPCSHVNGHIIKYRVQYTSESSGVLQSEDVNGAWDVGARSFLSGLTPNTNYTIRVAAVNAEGHVGLYSSPIVKLTAELGMNV